MADGNGNTADTAAAIAGLLREGLRHIQGRGDAISETATLDLLIKPTLAALGYPPTYRFPEYGSGGNRLDESCFLQEVAANPGRAAIIVEAKEYGTDFDKVPAGQPSANSPDQQIQRYLKQHKASGPNTFGVLTDGAKWRLYRRAGGRPRAKDAATNPDIEFLAEYNFEPLAQAEPALAADLLPDSLAQLAELVQRLLRGNIAYGVTDLFAAAPPDNRADNLFKALAEGGGPAAILREMLDEPEVVPQSRAAAALALTGVAKHAHDTAWGDYAYLAALPLQKSDQAALLTPKVVTAAVELPGLSRADTALAARAFAAADPGRAAALLAYTAAANGAREARLAVAANGQVNMTAAFDPTLAAPSARAAADQLLQLLHRPPAGGLTAEQLLLPLEAATLRQQFYREIAGWTTHWQAGKGRPQRQAVLRHLVRTMFAWILKEENIIPPELFEEAFARAALPAADDYHREILRFLFHQRLNIPEEQRGDHPIAAVNAALAAAQFLNGSLFAVHPEDDTLDLPAAAYWQVDGARPGLFTILARYHWTLDEHRPGESEQTLDPELLSNLFERLIAPTEEGNAVPLKQPQGTYYTPADVADEMVKDALAAAVRDQAPATVTEEQLRELFGSADAALPRLSAQQKRRLTGRIKELRIFDPAVGSGEFLLSALTALRRALAKLEPAAANPAAAIIRRQLAGQDIHPLAVQITRLRLFIAITAARRQETAPEPLPNLEARIVCADTLATVANPEWRPERPGRLTDAFPELTAALTGLAENRAAWFDAHTEAAKQRVLQRESQWRSQLEGLLQNRADLASPELAGFAQSSLYHINPIPAATDARLLFYENPWRGFDVVIGNPPYTDVSSVERKRLADKKGYQTTKVGDTYSLFCETALTLANPDGGVITMIVPLSLAFGQRQQSIRDLFEARSREISLRHYDNRPDTPFNASPTVKSPENRQRATVFTAILGRKREQKIVIKSGGLQRWLAVERAECLMQRSMVATPRLGGKTDKRVAGQWLRTPTREVAELVEVLSRQERTVMSYAYKGDAVDGVWLAWPQTAYRFIAVIPAGTVSPRRETLFRVKDMDDLRLLMAVLNGHIGFAWWFVVGDGFHVKPIADHGTLTVPNICSKNPEQFIEMGQKLLDAMPECIVVNHQQGNDWQNVNFHLQPELIEELDRLHLGALGYGGGELDQLLGQLRVMRSSSSWRFY